MSHVKRSAGWYDVALLARASLGPMTAKEVGSIMDRYPTDAVTSLRKRKDFTVTIVGQRRVQAKVKRVKLYQIAKREGSLNT